MTAVPVTDNAPPIDPGPCVPPRQSRKLVVFADGTGNAFTTQQSNVWRLFEALDQTDPDQIARYIPGVGTSGLKPFAILDGATGLGVPSNVRKLYRFLCWNWRPGDEIWMFGFSRGAFTVRTLAALIASEGLVPARFPSAEGAVSREGMERNAMAAWRAYRAKAAPAEWRRPTIAITRAIRDCLLAAWHRVLRHRSYADVRAEMARCAGNNSPTEEDPRENRIDVPIAFMGVFDTVEAFGVPIEEMRRAIDWVFWPIRFRNRVLSRNVQQARHALSLDDERTSFHPIQFDMRSFRDRIREVWFAGVHSDVGGGYPDASLAHVPLAWMLDEIAQLPSSLRFHRRTVKTFRDQASPFGPIHDSRSGLSVLYRYDPRTVRVVGAGHGSPNRAGWERPEVHHSVVARMTMGDDLYTPISLPRNAQVRLPPGAPGAGTLVALDDPRLLPALAARGGTPRPPQPAPGYFALVQARVWWRRAAYLALLLGFFVLLSLPVAAGPINSGFNQIVAWAFRMTGLSGWGEYVAERLFGLDSALANNIRLVAPAISGILPGFARIYVDTLLKFPLACALAATMGAIVLRQNNWLRDKIADDARCAWFGGSSIGDMSVLNRIGSAMRRVERVRALHRIWTKSILPGAFVILLVLLLGVGVPTILSSMVLAARSARGELCTGPNARPDASEGVRPSSVGNSLAEGEVRVIPEGFTPDSPCWRTGVRLEQGSRYRVVLSERVPFFDKDTISGLAGFPTRTAAHTLSMPLLRRLDAGWFQPIARIGVHREIDNDLNLAGGLEFPLNDIDGLDMRGDVQQWNGRPLPARIVQRHILQDLTTVSEKITSNYSHAAVEFHESLQRLPRKFVAEFVAEADGELFLFVNDAVFALPFLPTVWAFYQNNSGHADVTIHRLPRPSK